MREEWFKIPVYFRGVQPVFQDVLKITLMITKS